MSVAAQTPTVDVAGILSNRLKLVSLSFPVGHKPAQAVIEYLPGAPEDAESALPFTIGDLADVPLADGETEVIVTDGDQRFKGYVVDVELNSAQGTIQITAEDARSHFAKMPIRGRLGKNVDGNAATAPKGRWIHAATLTFNERGVADMLTAGGDGTSAAHRMFIQPEHMIDATGAENGDGATLWTPFDILTYVRQVYDKTFSATLEGTPATDLGNWNDWISWAAISDNNLKTDSDGNKLTINDFAVSGMGMGEAITETLNRVSRYSWYLDHSSSTPALKIRDADAGNFVAIPGIAPGGDIDDLGNAVGVASIIRLRKSNRDVYDESFAIGAKLNFESSFATEDHANGFGGAISETLIIGWNPDLEEPWRDRHRDKSKGDAKERQYQHVFRRWLLPAYIDWRIYFANDKWYIGPRPVGALLSSRDVNKDVTFLADPDLDLGPPVRRKFLLERHAKNADGDFEWQKLPENISITPSQDVGGFTLPDAARDLTYQPQGGEVLDSLAWSWQGDTSDADANKPFDMRLTVVIDADERLGRTKGTFKNHKRTLFINAGDSYQLKRRSNAVVPLQTDADNQPSIVPGISGGTRNDRETLDALAKRRIDKAAWSGMTGTVTLTQIDYFWHDKPGLLVDSVGDDDLPGDKPMLSSVVYDYENQTTTLALER